MANEVQEFSAEEETLLIQAHANLFSLAGAIVAHINRTGAEKKAFFVGQIDAQLTDIQNAIDNIDAALAVQKTQKLAELNARKELLEGLKTKLESLPE